jgi:TolB-like protein
MSKILTYISIMMLVLSVASVSAKSSGDTQTVVLLPVEQASIPANSKLSEAQLSGAMLTRLARLETFDLVKFNTLSQAFDKQIVDDAVFELIVTDDLKHMLARLNALETKAAQLAEYCKVGNEVGIDHLVDISVQQDATQLRVTYKVIDTGTGRIVLAKSFYDVPNDPIGVGDEIAKRIVRTLWQLEDRKL